MQLVEKKLRDVTNEEFKKWTSRECKAVVDCKCCIFSGVDCYANSKCNWTFNKDKFSDKFLDQKIEVEVHNILDEKEKEYLSYVIMPFRHRIEYIRKFKSGIILCISIKMIDNDFMYFPNFVNPNMYKGMQLDTKYTLKELGL